MLWIVDARILASRTLVITSFASICTLADVTFRMTSWAAGNWLSRAERKAAASKASIVPAAVNDTLTIDCELAPGLMGGAAGGNQAGRQNPKIEQMNPVIL